MTTGLSTTLNFSAAWRLLGTLFGKDAASGTHRRGSGALLKDRLPKLMRAD
jgi:hypothetical protein